MFQTLLFAHDFSPSSERALAYALDLTSRTGAALHLMHVAQTAEGVLFEGGKVPPSGELRDRFEDRCRKSLASQDLSASDLSADDDRLSYHAVRGGAPAPLLVQKAEEIDADLVVMGTEGRRGVQRIIAGSVAEEVLRTAPCPVLTARRREDEESRPSGVEVERIVVPVDFSDLSRAALQYVSGLAPLYDAPIRLVHVVEEPTLPSIYEVKSPKVQSRAAQERAEEQLRSWGESLTEDGTPVSYLASRGETPDAVVKETGQPGALTVMGTRGLSGARRVAMGSVTEAVIREADGPVLATRSSLETDSPETDSSETDG